MDLSNLQEFFDYKPTFAIQPQHLVDDIIARAAKYLPAKDLPQIQHTYEFSRAAHGDGLRLSGEPYIVHPLQATIFLMDLKPDLATIQTCILHDVLEDTEITYPEIEKEFGSEVAELCEWLVKVSKIKYRGEERQIETLKKTFLAMGKDLRVIFVKLVDRIHNIQTLHYHPKPEKQRRIAEETLEIYVPIAKRLWLYHYQQLLENGAFRILYPKEFTLIMQYLDKQISRKSDLIQEGVEKLQQLLDQQLIEYCSIRWRIKSPYRMREKMRNKYKSMDFGNITDLIAFRIVTKTVGECYNVLWYIHHSYTPVIKKIKDYIAVPKFNEYRSLHTTILWLYDFPVEVQIRTQEMEDIAEWGVAAHFAYAEKKWSVSVGERQAQWIKKLQELVSSYTANDDKEWFRNELNIELLEASIFVYTQKWDVVELPENSTVLDFAFRIHSDIGLKFNNALVNGSITNIGYKLKTGDIVYISTYKNKWTASGNRFEYLHTPSAKAKLTKFLKHKEKEQLVEQSMAVLQEKLKEHKLPLLHTKHDRISQTYKGEKFDRLLLQLMDRQMWYIALIKKVYKDILPESLKQPIRTKTMPQVISAVRDDIVLDGVMRLGYFLCPECQPKPWDAIIARSWKDGIKIHRVSCYGVSSVSPWRLIEAHRWDQDVARYTLMLKLQCADKPGILFDILHIFTTLSLNISHINSENHTATTQYVTILADTSHPSKLHFLLQELKKLGQYVKLMKKEIS
jgi:GTP diphosphokinase / guanosine-3',5'-bis(diphosphate) 3'-diphosphatase